MKSKNNYLQSLQNVKLIIGNGFDLHCGLETKYSSYFLRNEGKINTIKNFEREVIHYQNTNVPRPYVASLYKTDIRNINFWDLLFYLESKDDEHDVKDWKWCDVKKVMYNFICEDEYECSAFAVYKIIDGFENNGLSQNAKVLAIYVIKRFEKDSLIDFSIDDLYSFLMDELKLFEKNFAKYIKYTHDIIDKSSCNFKTRASITISQLCNPQNIISIESFNYDDLENKKLNSFLNHINGSLSEQPIFGIDSKNISAADVKYIFTKTCRRMENDMNSIFPHLIKEFKNIIVFGHSLNEADYSYFFSIFDKIHLSDLSNDSKIIFAFDIYNDSKAEIIKSTLRKNISVIFENYAKYLKISEPQRLLDSMTSLGKVVMFEIEKIDWDDIKRVTSILISKRVKNALKFLSSSVKETMQGYE